MPSFSSVPLLHFSTSQPLLPITAVLVLKDFGAGIERAVGVVVVVVVASVCSKGSSVPAFLAGVLRLRFRTDQPRFPFCRPTVAVFLVCFLERFPTAVPCYPCSVYTGLSSWSIDLPIPHHCHCRIVRRRILGPPLGAAPRLFVFEIAADADRQKADLIVGLTPKPKGNNAIER